MCIRDRYKDTAGGGKDENPEAESFKLCGGITPEDERQLISRRK